MTMTAGASMPLKPLESGAMRSDVQPPRDFSKGDANPYLMSMAMDLGEQRNQHPLALETG